ncbi:MAG: amidohydrolase, partial [Fusobacteriaceae bacterium]
MDQIELMKKIIVETLDKHKDEFQEINSYIFKNPELGNEEYISSEYLAEYLRKKGFAVTKPFCGMETAFKAEYITDPSAPRVAFLAEYDALPGYGENGEAAHACGHNWIAATALGAGVVLAKTADLHGGNVVIIGTPAEETTGGKCPMVKEGAFQDIDFIFQSHIGDKNNINCTTLAMDSLEFNFTGKAAHAACFPEKGINALDGVN